MARMSRHQRRHAPKRGQRVVTTVNRKRRAGAVTPLPPDRKPKPRVDSYAIGQSNTRCVYETKYGWYVIWQACKQVYRKAFATRKYGTRKAAFAAAVAEARWLEQNRAEIERQITDAILDEMTAIGVG